MKIKDIFIALLVPIILGFGFVIAKPAMEYFPTYLLMGMRFTIPALILVWWFPLPKGLYLDLFKVSFIGNTLQYGLTYTGLNIIDASSAVLLIQLEVPFGIIIAFFLLKEIPTIKNIVGLDIAFTTYNRTNNFYFFIRRRSSQTSFSWRICYYFWSSFNTIYKKK